MKKYTPQRLKALSEKLRNLCDEEFRAMSVSMISLARSILRKTCNLTGETMHNVAPHNMFYTFCQPHFHITSLDDMKEFFANESKKTVMEKCAMLVKKFTVEFNKNTRIAMNATTRLSVMDLKQQRLLEEGTLNTKRNKRKLERLVPYLFNMFSIFIKLINNTLFTIALLEYLQETVKNTRSFQFLPETDFDIVLRFAAAHDSPVHVPAQVVEITAACLAPKKATKKTRTRQRFAPYTRNPTARKLFS